MGHLETIPEQGRADGDDWLAARESAVADAVPVTDAMPVDEELRIEVLEARICGLATRMAQATYHWLAMIARFDERGGWVGVGIKSCAHWLAWTCSIAPGTAREHVRVARALTSLPIVSREMAAGRLSYAKVRELTRVSDRIDESRLVELARTATASQYARAVRGFRRADGDRGRQEQSRRASWWTDTDGSVVLSARLPAEEGAVVIAALEAARDDLRRGEEDAEADRGGSATHARGDTDTDTPCDPASGSIPKAIDPADAMLHWARGYLAAAPEDRSGEDRTTVVVHVGAEHLDPAGADPAGADPAGADSAGADSAGADSAGADSASPDPAASAAHKRSRGNADNAANADNADNAAAADDTAIPPDCCEVAGVGGVERETAARLACDATLIGVIRGRGGAVLAHGRRRRVVSAAQRRALQVRDGGCRFPSCQRVSHLDAHHVQHWSKGGRTDMDNLVLLCRFHHVACHEGGVEIAAAVEPRSGMPGWRFITADGEPIRGTIPSPDDTVPGWKHEDWILWHALDGSRGRRDPEAAAIRPLWAGERFSLAETVSMLFGSPKKDNGAEKHAAAA